MARPRSATTSSATTSNVAKTVPADSAIGKALKGRNDLAERMAVRLPDLGNANAIRSRSKNPAIPNNFLDFSDSGLPKRFQYHTVEVPNPNSPLYPHQLAVEQAYLQEGFTHLPEDMVSSDPSDPVRAYLPNYVPIDGKVTVSQCYLMYADREWYGRKRSERIAARNAIHDKVRTERSESLEDIGGIKNRQTVEVESRRDVSLELLDREEQGQEDEGGTE